MLFCNILWAADPVNIILNCQSYEVTLNNKGTQEIKTDSSDKIVFKIDLKKNKIYKLTQLSRDFEPIEGQPIFTDSKIKWSSKDLLYQKETFNSIDKYTAEYVSEIFFSKESPDKENAGTYLKSMYRCQANEINYLQLLELNSYKNF